MTATPTVAIAYHSGRGHTAVLAEAVRQGVTDAGGRVAMIQVESVTDDQWSTLDAADAIVFGSPTYMGTASGAFHAFAESTSQRWLDRTASWMTGHLPRVRVVRLRPAEAVAALGCRRPGFYLIRPDGHLAAHGHESDLHRLRAELDSVLSVTVGGPR